jgi:hypothetical protein
MCLRSREIILSTVRRVSAHALSHVEVNFKGEFNIFGLSLSEMKSARRSLALRGYMELVREPGQQVDKFPSHALPSTVAVATRVYAHPILSLQRTIGNQAVQRLLKSRVLQAKLTVGRPDDIYEQEAEQVANQVVAVAPSPSQRTCACGGAGPDECEACREKRQASLASPVPLQRQDEGDPEIEEAPAVVDEVLSSPGHPLDDSVRSFMEGRFEHDFSNVRVHSDAQAVSSARAVDALAYTVGRHVVFGAGQYAPSSTSGRKLLAHELVHTIQQGAVRKKSLQRVHLDAAGRKTFDCPDFVGDEKLEACLNDEDRLRPSDRGPTVVKVQNGLLRDGADLGKDGVDGIYGPATGRAVMAEAGRQARSYGLGTST